MSHVREEEWLRMRALLIEALVELRRINQSMSHAMEIDLSESGEEIED